MTLLNTFIALQRFISCGNWVSHQESFCRRSEILKSRNASVVDEPLDSSDDAVLCNYDSHSHVAEVKFISLLSLFSNLVVGLILNLDHKVQRLSM